MGRRIVMGTVVLMTVAMLGPAHVAAQDQPEVTTAVLSINPDTGKISDYAYGNTSSGGSQGAPATSSYFFYEFCYPPTGGEGPESGGATVGTLTVAPDGALHGECTRTARGGKADRTSTLTGKYDKAAGTVAFHLQGQSVNDVGQGVTYSYTLSVDGPPASVEGDTAKSQAPFSFTCVSSNPTVGNCPFTSITGTLDASMIFPELTGASSSPTSVAAAPRQAAAPTEEENSFLLVLVLLGVAAAVIAAVFLAFRNRARRRAASPRGPDGGLHGAVGADRSGGFEDLREYGEGAGSAAPAASKAYEGLVVAQGPQTGPDEPLIDDSEARAEEQERERERETDPDTEGR